MDQPRVSFIETAVKRLQYLSYRLPPWVLNGGLLLLLLLLFFHKMILSNLILARGDTFLYFYPYWEMAAEALRAGRVPHWNPHIFMGAPFLANSQVGFFYPLNWLVWFPFATPYAAKASIVLHILIAMWGAYLAGERAMGLDRSGAVVTAVLFALGGYLTAQIEHINQLQGLAWLPWYLVVLTYAGDEKVLSNFVVVAKTAVGLTLLFSLQFLAGHTQTLFISIVMVLLWSVGKIANYYLNAAGEDGLLFRFSTMRYRVRVPAALLIGGGLALLVTAVQLLPTFQLTQLSSRSGGLTLNEALSFSLHPLLLTRALLPAYNQSLFTEYIAIVPGTAVVLAVIGVWQWRRWRGVFPALLLVVVGLLLALGQFNPLNWLIFRLPGFNLFRVPARWLALYGLGMALLAGLGWQIVLDRYLLRSLSWREVPERARETLWHVQRPLRVGIYLLIGLILWSSIATILSIFIPTGPEAPYEAPNALTLLLWVVEIVLVFLWISGQRIQYDPAVRLRFVIMPGRVRSPWPLLGVMVILLFWGTRTHPYHLNLTAPEAYLDLHPVVSRLQTAVPCQPSPNCTAVPGRILSLSNIQFDPGDLGELETIYAESLDGVAWDDFVVAQKQKAILGPNLAMSYGLYTVDGFDGGILPLASYSDYVALELPDGATTTDGRLREQLTAVPDPVWLDAIGVQYLITDKTGDVWLDVTAEHNAFFDMQHPVRLAAGDEVTIGYLPPFVGDSLIVVGEGTPPLLTVTTVVDEVVAIEAEPTETGLWRYDWMDGVETAVFSTNADVLLKSAVLFNSGNGTFQSVVLGNYRQIYSGDVKIYENLDVAPSYFQVGASDNIEVTSYAPERVSLRIDSEGERLYTDSAYYPGWQATIDGEPVEIALTDQFFMAVDVPEGEHEVEFVYDSRTYFYGRSATFIGLFILTFLLATFALLEINTRFGN